MIARTFLLLGVTLLLAGCSAAPRRTFGDRNLLARASAFSSDGSLLAAGLNDGTVRVWDVRTGRLIARTDGFVRSRQPLADSIAFSPDNRLVAFAGDDASVLLWRYPASESPQILRGHDLAVRQILFAPDGVRLLTASGGQRSATHAIEPIRIVIYSTSDGSAIKTLEDPIRGGYGLGFAPGGDRFACLRYNDAGAKSSVQVTVGDLFPKEAAEAVSGGVGAFEVQGSGDSIQFSPDGLLVSTGSSVWDVQTGLLMRRLNLPVITFVDSRTVLALEQGFGSNFEFVARTPWFEPSWVDVWNNRSTRGAERAYQPPMVDAFFSARFTPDGRAFVDQKLRLWEMPRKRPDVIERR